MFSILKIKRIYHSKILDHHFERAMDVDRIILLENKEKPSTQHLPTTRQYPILKKL